MTRLLRLSGDPQASPPPEVVDALRNGEMVVCPTDTLYGIAVDPRNEAAVSRLVSVKRRDAGKPIPLLLADAAEAGRWARGVPEGAARLMRRFWPGALTLVLPAADGIHPAITAGGGTVGLRVPDHPVPRALARGVSGAVTGTSANRAGEAGAWSCAEQIVREFRGEVAWVLWEGPAQRATPAAPGPGSTVVGMSGGRPVLFREGAIPFRDITEFLDRG